LLACIAIGLGVTLAVEQVRIFNPNAQMSLPVDASRSVAPLASMVTAGIAAALLLTLLSLLVSHSGRNFPGNPKVHGFATVTAFGTTFESNYDLVWDCAGVSIRSVHSRDSISHLRLKIHARCAVVVIPVEEMMNPQCR
jgi:hypothetical protein